MPTYSRLYDQADGDVFDVAKLETDIDRLYQLISAGVPYYGPLILGYFLVEYNQTLNSIDIRYGSSTIPDKPPPAFPPIVIW